MKYRSEETGKEKKKNGLLLAALGSVCFLAVFMGVLLWQMHSTEKTEAETAKLEEEEPVLVKEAGAVRTEEKAADTTTARAGKKTTIRIIEVIPHQICSVFPYMVEWGSVEGYDENTPIGYEGVRYLATHGNGNGYETSSALQYGLIREGMAKDYLPSYNETFMDPSSGNWSRMTGWWKETDANRNITGVNGYFEYVGDAKGLYNINLSEDYVIKASNGNKNGIRYRVMARERKGSESPKGEWKVADPQYFWAEDYGRTSLSYPTSDIKTKTGYDYDVIFSVGTGTDGKGYSVYSVKGEESTQSQDDRYEYEAVWTGDSTREWTGGYRYKKEGNYKAAAADAKAITKDSYTAADAIQDGFSYVWVSLADGSKKFQKADGNGYYRLLDESSDVLSSGCYVYKLTFSKVTAGKGDYVLNPSAVKSLIAADSTTAGNVFKTLQFEYAGAKKGTYDVVFIYAGSGTGNETLYTSKINKVTDGDGRYALTSTAANEDKLYVEGTGDYSKTITRIDCAGIDFTSFQNSWGGIEYTPDGYWNDTNNIPGLTMGCSKYNIYAYGAGTDRGGWVFHTVSSDEKNGYTTLEELISIRNSPKVGDRIYVYQQNRKYRCYMCTGIKSTEWFKLLMYLSNDDDTAGLAAADYAAGMDPLKIVEKYKDRIEDFDRTYQIEIEQKTPGQLTADDVENADLLYFSRRISLVGMSVDTWNKIASNYKTVSPYYQSDPDYSDDLSVSALMAIYKNCLYDQTTALLFDANSFVKYGGDGSHVDTNLGKMYMLTNLFRDPMNFSYFMEGYQEYDDDYTMIHQNGSLTYYEQQVNGVGTLYNLGRIKIDSNPNVSDGGDELPGTTTDVWSKTYFRVVSIYPDYDSYQWKLDPQYADGYGKFGDHWGYSSWENFRGEDVNGDRTWYIPEDMRDLFMQNGKVRNIWSILHSRKSKRSSEPVVVVTNADGNNISMLENIEPLYYFYVDDYSDTADFDVTFKVNWKPEEITDPLSLTLLVMEREEGGQLFAEGVPSYQTEYTCNVAGDFLNADGTLNETVTSRTYIITATDEKGNTDSARVIVIVRKSFMLN